MKITGPLFILALILFTAIQCLFYRNVQRPKLLEEAQAALAATGIEAPMYIHSGMDVVLQGSVETLELRDKAQQIVDEIFGLRALSTNNQISAPGLFQTAYDPDSMHILVRGSLNSKDTVDQLKQAIQEGGSVPVLDRIKIHRKISEPRYLTSKSFLDLLRKLHKTPQPVSVSAGERTLLLEGPTTDEMQEEWFKLIREIQTESGQRLDVKTDLQMFSSVYHMPGYFRTRRSAELNRDEFNRLAAELGTLQIFFDSGESKVNYNDPVAKDILEKLVALIKKQRKPVFFVIGGHADAQGSAQANQRLARSRAEWVKDWLVTMGNIPEEKLVIVSFGSSMATGNQNSPDARAKSRRVEVRIQ